MTLKDVCGKDNPSQADLVRASLSVCPSKRAGKGHECPADKRSNTNEYSKI